jgi:hypothetical protein
MRCVRNHKISSDLEDCLLRVTVRVVRNRPSGVATVQWHICDGTHNHDRADERSRNAHFRGLLSDLCDLVPSESFVRNRSGEIGNSLGATKRLLELPALLSRGLTGCVERGGGNAHETAVWVSIEACEMN